MPAGALNIEHPRTLQQQDLAIIMCQRWAYEAFVRGNPQGTS
jgi:hypothetical protein